MGQSSSKEKKAAAAKAASTANPVTFAAAAAAPTATTPSSTFTADDRVTTFAGAGTVVSAADGMVTVTLDWKLAQGQGATAHFNDASVTVFFTAGDRVTTFAGAGTVVSAADGMATVTLDWKLAQGQGATAHFSGASVTLGAAMDRDPARDEVFARGGVANLQLRSMSERTEALVVEAVGAYDAAKIYHGERAAPSESDLHDTVRKIIAIVDKHRKLPDATRTAMQRKLLTEMKRRAAQACWVDEGGVSSYDAATSKAPGKGQPASMHLKRLDAEERGVKTRLLARGLSLDASAAKRFQPGGLRALTERTAMVICEAVEQLDEFPILYAHSRKDLQALAKANGVKANGKSDTIRAALKVIFAQARAAEAEATVEAEAEVVAAAPIAEEEEAARSDDQPLLGDVVAAILDAVESEQRGELREHDRLNLQKVLRRERLPLQALAHAIQMACQLKATGLPRMLLSLIGGPWGKRGGLCAMSFLGIQNLMVCMQTCSLLRRWGATFIRVHKARSTQTHTQTACSTGVAIIYTRGYFPNTLGANIKGAVLEAPDKLRVAKLICVPSLPEEAGQAWSGKLHVTDGVVSLTADCTELLCVSSRSHGGFIEDASLKMLAEKCRKLTTVAVRNSGCTHDSAISNMAVRSLVSNCTGLTSVNFEGHDALTIDSFLAVASHCPSLRAITFLNCGPITASFCSSARDHVSGLWSTQTLAIKNLFKCPKLKRIDIRNREAWCLPSARLESAQSPQFQSAVQELAKHCPELTSFVVNEKLTPTTIETLVENCHGMMNIIHWEGKRVNGLPRFVIDGMTLIGESRWFTDSVLIRVATTHPELTKVILSSNLAENHITDKSIVALSKMCCLMEHIDLGPADVFDRSIDALRTNCRKLKSVAYDAEDSGFKPAALDRLRKANVEVIIRD